MTTTAVTRGRLTWRAGLALMTTPLVVGFVALVLLPGLGTVVLALYDYDFVRSPHFVGLANFRELLADDIFRISLRNSLAFTALAVPLRVLGAVGLGLLLARRSRVLGASRTAAFLPTIVPDVAYGVMWLWLLNPLYGPVNLALGAVGAPTPAWLTEPAAAQGAVILMSAFQIGEGMVLVLAARSAIPAQVYEVAALDGASSWMVLRRITLPWIAPVVALLALRDCIYSFQASFVPALIVTEGGPPPFATTYLPLFVYRNGFEYLRYGYASAATVAMLGVTLLVLFAQYTWVGRRYART